MSGLELLGKIKNEYHEPPPVVMMITAYGDVNLAVKAIKEGATDFVLKPWENERLLATLNSALNLRQKKLEVNLLTDQKNTLQQDLDNKFKDIIGQSPAMQKVFETIERVAATDANVLILGENGTGKELIARAIHRHSRRNREAFVGVDLGSITSTLFESELFGHKKGSFTDAKEDRAGGPDPRAAPTRRSSSRAWPRPRGSASSGRRRSLGSSRSPGSRRRATSATSGRGRARS